jgi:hypothetical protein
LAADELGCTPDHLTPPDITEPLPLPGTDRGRLSASLALLELAPNPMNTQTVAVRLVARKA